MSNNGSKSHKYDDPNPDSVTQAAQAQNEESKEETLLNSQEKTISAPNKGSDMTQENNAEQGKFGNPPEKAEKPKTANEAFGGILEFLLFFENRNPKIKDFAKKFQEIEQLNEKLALEELEQVIVPQINECLNEEFKKSEEYKKPENKRKNKYAKLFTKTFETWEEFYKQVLHAYTINGFLYLQMNKYLRDEDWVQLDALLPYTYCLFKAFLWGPAGLTVQGNFEALKAKAETQGNKLILYRGVDFDDDALDFYDPLKIKNFSWNGVISTSLNKDIAIKFQQGGSKRPVLIIIEIDFEDLQPEDLNALYLAKFSAIPKEEEVAIAPGGIFKLLEINKDKPEVEMRLRLVTNAKALAHEGQFLHGLLQAIMRSEDELKFVCLKEKDLSRALNHCKGNKLIKDLEFCFCTFNQKAMEVLSEVISTIENLTSLTLNIVRLEESCQLESVLECIGKTGIKKLQILDTLIAKRHIQGLIEGINHLRSLEYLKLTFEEECEMDAELFIDLLKVSSQFLYPHCIFDVDIAKSYNLMAKGFKLHDFEQSGGIDAIKKGWPAGCASSSKSFDGKSPAHDLKVKEKPTGDFEMENIRNLDSFELEDERYENIEIIGSAEGTLGYCMAGVKGETLFEVLESKFRLTPEREKNDKLAEDDAEEQDCFQENLGSLEIKQTNKVELLTSLHLHFKRFPILDSNKIWMCMHELPRLQSLTTLHLDFYGCENFSDEGLRGFSCEKIKDLSELTSLKLNFQSCSEITDEGLKSLTSGGIQHLSQLTSLHLDFGNCYKITDEGLKCLSSGGIQHLSQLTSLHLNFRDCSEITDEGLRSLSSGGIQHLSQLTSLHLDFWSCSEITDEGLKSFGSEEIKSLPKLTWLYLSFSKCASVNTERLKNICSEETQYRSIQEKGSFEYKCPRGNFQNLIVPESSTSEFGTASVGYNLQPGFYFKEFPLKSETRLLKLLANYSPFYLKEKQSLKNYHVLLHLNSLPGNITNQTPNQKDISDVLDKKAAITNWQGTEALSLIFNVGGENLKTEEFGKLYKNILHCFKSIRKLHLRSNQADAFSDNVLWGLFYKSIENLNSLESINFIFPAIELDETVKKSSLKESSSFLSFTFLTKRRMSCKNEVLQLSSRDFQPSTLNQKFQIFKIKNQKTQRAFQNNVQQRNSFQFGKTFYMDPQHAMHQTDFSRQKIDSPNKNQQTKSGLLSKTRGIHENCLDVVEESNNFQEKSKSVTSREIDFSCNKNISIQELSFKEFYDLKSLLRLTLNFSRRNDITDEELKSLSLAISSLRLLEVLNLSFHACRVTDVGLLSLSSQGLKQLSKLTELYLDFGFCNRITDKGLDYLSCEGIKYLELLTKLNLNFGYCFGLENLKCQVIGSLKLLTELRLNFNSCTRVADFGWISCGLQNLKSLTILSLDFEFNNIHSRNIQSLSQEFQHLESLIDLNLNFRHCVGITDIGIEWLVNGIQHLKSLNSLVLNFSKCARISDQGIKDLSCRGVWSLKSLAMLSLNFGECPKISDKGIKDLSCKVIKDLKSLTSLRLTFDGTITNKGLKALCCEGIRHLTSLVSLHLNICKGISDEEIESLCCEGIQHLDNLTTLELISQGENIITDQGIKNLAFKAIPKLLSLDYLQLPLMQTVTSSSSISEAFRNILIYFGLQKAEN